MGNHLKFCSCDECRRGRKGKYGSKIVLLTVRRARRKAKEALRQGKEPNKTESVPYTD
jgi:hypothetical protein